MEEGIEVMVREAERIFRFKQQVMEELQAQRVYTALASSPSMVVSSSHISGDEEGWTLLLAQRLQAWLMPPPLSSS